MKRLITSCFGLGWLPIAPGTWGSLPPTMIFAGMWLSGASDILIAMVMIALILLGSIICVLLAPEVVDVLGKIDPGEVVADEFAGQALTFLVPPFIVGGSVSAKQICMIAAVGFLLFRIFDIAKPWPIRKLEKLPQGWGILADDLLAGVFATLVLIIGMQIFITH